MSVVQEHLREDCRSERKLRNPDTRSCANCQAKDKFDKQIRYKENKWNWRRSERWNGGVDRAELAAARVRSRNGNDWRSRGNGEARAYRMGNAQQRKPFRNENQRRPERSSDGFWRRRDNDNYANVKCRVCRERGEVENLRNFGWKRSSGFDRWKGVPRCHRDEQWWRKPHWER